MKTLYFDIIGGISGDMIVSSLLNITGDLEYLKQELKKIDLDRYDLRLSKCQSGHISSHRFLVRDLAKKKRVFQLDAIKSKINTIPNVTNRIFRVIRHRLQRITTSLCTV